MMIDMFEAPGVVVEVLPACFSSANYTDLQHITLIVTLHPVCRVDARSRHTDNGKKV